MNIINYINKNIFKSLYNFFSILFIFLIFFSTTNLQAKIYKVDNIEVISPYTLNFNKDEVIDEAFLLSFELLMKKILNSNDINKVNLNKIKIIKDMIVSFEIANEEFINKNYSASINVLYDKKKVLSFLNKKNIISSIPNEKKILFLPILINLESNDLIMYNENIFYQNWNKNNKKYYLLDYILLEEDIEDFSKIKKNISNIENYDFKDLINKYDYDEFIISIFFYTNGNMNVLSKLKINNKLSILKADYKEIDIQNTKKIKNLIFNLKEKFENKWKKSNEINPSIKLALNVSLNSKNLNLIKDFESIINSSDLVSNFYIEKISNTISIYRIIYNGTPDKFIYHLKKNNFKVDISEKIWSIEQ